MAYALSIGTKIIDLGWPWTAVRSHFRGIYTYSWYVWEATTAKKMKIDRYCQWGNCCALKVLFNDL